MTTPLTDQRDHTTQRQGWQRPDPGRAFRLSHWDYDERQIDGWDYDIGAEQVRTGTAGDESGLLDPIAEWGLAPDQFRYPCHTADPR